MTDMVIPPVILAAEVEPWLQECGSCDYGLAMGCNCPKGDYRNILLKLWKAYTASQSDIKAMCETVTKVALELGRKEALDQTCGCILGPVHTLGDHLHMGAKEASGD